MLLWLCWQQTRSFALVLLPCSVAAGLLVMAEGAILWPAVTLLLGVLCGVAVFADEQTEGAFRFLGDQRLPPAKVWLAKTGMWLTLTLVAGLLAVLPSVVRSVLHTEQTLLHPGPRTFLAWLFRDPVLGEVAAPGAFLSLWLLHGFGFGQLCGMLVRKSVVAAFLALGASGLAACLWLPSLAGGGLHLWQVAGVPALALAASWLLLPAWTGGRLSGATLARGVAAAAGAAILWTAAAIAYRVVEIPDTPDRLDMPAFLAELPAPAQNEAGELTRRACEGLSARLHELTEERPTKPLFPRGKREGDKEFFEGQAGEVVEHGWPGGEPELSGWLDRVFAARWPGELARAADFPTGIVFDPRRITIDSPLRELDPARKASLLLAVHGLYRQARGDDAAFAADLRAGLALSRNLRNHSVRICVLTAIGIEAQLLEGVDRWLERLHGRPDLLREALAVLRRHEDLLPDDSTDTQRAGFLIVENSLKHPEGWLGRGLSHDVYQSSSDPVAAVGVAWQVPWEHERQQRLLRLLFADNPSGRLVVLRAAPWMRELPQGVRMAEERDNLRWGLTFLRARLLEVALRLYQAEKGKPATALEALVPGILPEIPRDPFGSGPFHYRLSAGERIEWLTPNRGAPAGPGVAPDGPATRLVPAGQGILWSVGPDGTDNGGLRQGIHVRGGQTDPIFLVPLPPEK